MPTTPSREFAVLYEDNHLLAVSKPAMLPTMGVAPDVPSLLSLAKDYIKDKYNKPGAVYLGVVSRLDAPVTGVLLLARTSKAAKRLNEQFRDRQVEKIYWAAIEGRPDRREAALTHWVRKDERHRKMHLATEDEQGAQQAKLEYRLIGDLPRGSLVEVKLLTGRKHQIRVQLSALGHPIWGDRKYGASRVFPDGIALHSRKLVIEHPVKRTTLEIVAPAPKSWRQAGIKNPE